MLLFLLVLVNSVYIYIARPAKDFYIWQYLMSHVVLSVRFDLKTYIAQLEKHFFYLSQEIYKIKCPFGSASLNSYIAPIASKSFFI